MEANKILSADLLDLVFDGRNKDYGAYELRKTYGRRISRALLSTLAIALLALAGSLAAKAFHRKTAKYHVDDLTIQTLKEDKKVEIPPVIKPPVTPRVQMTRFTPPRIVQDDEVKQVIEENKKLDSSKISVVTQDGLKDVSIAPSQIDEGKQVVETKKETDEDKTFTIVEIEAQFPGGDAGWAKYLQRNLRGDVPTENGAPTGDYTVIVQFVVDKDGNVSDVMPLTSHGYGMEDEAVRVIKKGPQWKPAVQNGRNVKAYRKQPITFRIQES